MNTKIDNFDDFYLSDSNNEEDFKYYDNEIDFEYYDSDKDKNLNSNRFLEEENEEEDMLITLPLHIKRISKVQEFFNKRTLKYLRLPICKKCGRKFSADTGISTLKYYLKNKHNIKISQIITNQIKFPFPHIDSQPTKEKQKYNDALVIWIIVDQQSFYVVENKEFVAVFNKFDLYYIVLNYYQIKDIVILYFKLYHSRIINNLKQISKKVLLISDIWILILTTEAFLDLSIYYVDDGWVLHHFLLDIISFKIRLMRINKCSAYILNLGAK